MIRPGEARDFDDYVRLFKELGTDDPTPTRASWLAAGLPNIMVYERDGAVVGYTSMRWLQSAAHVMHLAVAPEARRTGVGRELMAWAAAEARRRGLREWHLNVKVGNVPARALYESCGMTPRYDSAFMRIAWACLASLPEEPDAVFSMVDEREDAELEQAFGLLAGRLAAGRSRGGRVIAKLRDAAGVPLGVASFDPNHPGSYPFCVARPACARPLLEGLRPHARPGDSWLGVTAENNEALVDALVAAGAEVRMRIVHYAGQL